MEQTLILIVVVTGRTKQIAMRMGIRVAASPFYSSVYPANKRNTVLRTDLSQRREENHERKAIAKLQERPVRGLGCFMYMLRPQVKPRLIKCTSKQ